MTMNVRQELCAVMVFAVVDKAGSIVMENEEEVGLVSWNSVADKRRGRP